MTHHPATSFRDELRQRIERAEDRMRLSGSEIEREQNRQIVIWLRSYLDERVSA